MTKREIFYETPKTYTEKLNKFCSSMGGLTPKLVLEKLIAFVIEAGPDLCDDLPPDPETSANDISNFMRSAVHDIALEMLKQKGGEG